MQPSHRLGVGNTEMSETDGVIVPQAQALVAQGSPAGSRELERLGAAADLARPITQPLEYLRRMKARHLDYDTYDVGAYHGKRRVESAIPPVLIMAARTRTIVPSQRPLIGSMLAQQQAASAFSQSHMRLAFRRRSPPGNGALHPRRSHW